MTKKKTEAKKTETATPSTETNGNGSKKPTNRIEFNYASGSHIGMVSVDDLVVLQASKNAKWYQRDIVKTEVDEIVKDFDSTRFLFLTVTENENNPKEFNVIDGQQRHAAAKRVGVKFVPCLIMPKCSIVEQATLYVAKNAEARKLSPFDDFRGAISKTCDIAMGIEELLNTLGLVIAKNSSSNSIACIGAITKIYDGSAVLDDVSGPERLTDVLKAIKMSWFFSKKSLTSNLILGVNNFFNMKRGATPEKSSQKWIKVSLEDLEEKFLYNHSKAKSTCGYGRTSAMGKTLMTIYRAKDKRT
jgi:hypothetical protein